MVDTNPDPTPKAEIAGEIAAVYGFYRALARGLDPETGLGGRLLYAGELNENAFRLVRAANIVALASLSATANPDMQKRAIRAGVVDFMVTSLDEALRILKNEIRKRQGVSVAIEAPPEAVEREMLDRGVLPDLLYPGAEFRELRDRGAEVLEKATIPSGKTLLTLELPHPLARHAAELDALLLAFVGEEDFANRRWFKLSPRYLDGRVRLYRSLLCDLDAASILAGRVAQEIEKWRQGN